MTVIHTVVPFEDRLRHDDVLVWLGFDIPANVKAGRYPTPNELKTVIDKLNSYSVKYQQGSNYWLADISSEYPILSIEAIRFSNNPDHTQEFRFSGDRALLTQLLRNLPEDCGTFLLTTEGEEPEFVTSGEAVP